MSAKPQQNPLVCHGHSRPIVEMQYSPNTEDGYFLISASKGGTPPPARGAPEG
jgi:serine-threonine kinase receptor-associated protein